MFLSHNVKSSMYGPHTSDLYNRIGAICELNMFIASLVG